MALYAYGLMRADDARKATAAAKEGGARHEGGAGREGGAQQEGGARQEGGGGLPSVRSVEHEGLAALVSEIGEGTVQVRREMLTGHVDVLRAAFRHGPVLPLRFGTALPDEESVQRELLGRDTAAMIVRLQALEGKAEMQVKASYMEEPLLRSVLSENQELAQVSERIRGLPDDATHFERIRLGEGIAAAVEARRDADAQQLLDAFSPFAVAVVVGELQHERMALNAAFLVENGGLQRFDAAVEELSRARAQDMEFKLIGPLPAHSFADRQWEAQPPPPRAQGVSA